MNSFIFCSIFVLFQLISQVQGGQGQVSVSGLSSGGFAAVQYHVVYSSQLIGCGVIAGGPYWCANANIIIALTACTQFPEEIVVSELILATTFAESLGTIDGTSYLANQKVWLFSGSQDTIVRPGVMEKLESYYLNYVEKQNIATEFNISAEHSIVTNDYGHNCEYFGTPFINNCDYDSAGNMLQHIYGPLAPPANFSMNNMLTLFQSNFIPNGYNTDTAALQDIAYFYLPSNKCAKGGCSIHIVFHGCNQTLDDINTIFVQHAGFNGWAESNDIIVLYPQAKKTLLNPEGCWDWWGYTGLDYATNLAPQMITVNSMVLYLQKQYQVDI